MSNAKKRKMNHQSNDGRYQRTCQEYAERDELEALNRKTEERVAMAQQLVWEHEKKAEMDRIAHERKFDAVMSIIEMIVLALGAITALCVLSHVEILDWIFTIIVSNILVIAGAFRAGYLWHEIKK